MITYVELKKLLTYNPETGLFFWNKRLEKSKYDKSWNTRYANKVAGTILSTNCYRNIKIHKISYLSSRLAWLYMTGNWPENEVDHINLDKTDDRWSNLREANRSENCCNKLPQSNNTSGYPGVGYNKRTKKWFSHIKINQKRLWLGTFSSKQEAIYERQKHELKYFGDFRIYK